MTIYDDMFGYHGTTDSAIKNLENGNIDRTRGGGELGQGFYLSNHPWVAFRWAEHKHNSKKVLEIKMKEDDFWGFTPLILNIGLTQIRRNEIKQLNLTRIYIFNEHIVCAPIVGRPFPSNVEQFKFESVDSEDYLNGTDVTGKI